ncbi:MAG: tetratricopeptide repeat protein, partial [bacterium]
ASNLRGILKDYEKRWGDESSLSSSSASLTKEEMDKIMSLGYVALGSTKVKEISGKFPRDMIHLVPQLRIGMDTMEDKNYGIGIEIMDSVLKEDPENKTALYYRGMGLFRLGKLDEATKDLIKLLELYPDNGYAYRGLADIHAFKKDWQALVDLLSMALGYFPKDEDFHYKIAIAFLQLGHADKALNHVRLIQDFSSHFYHAYLLASKCYLLMGREKEAIEEIRKVYQLGFRNFTLIQKDPVFLKIRNSSELTSIFNENSQP